MVKFGLGIPALYIFHPVYIFVLVRTKDSKWFCHSLVCCGTPWMVLQKLCPMLTIFSIHTLVATALLNLFIQIRSLRLVWCISCLSSRCGNKKKCKQETIRAALKLQFFVIYWLSTFSMVSVLYYCHYYFNMIQLTGVY